VRALIVKPHRLSEPGTIGEEAGRRGFQLVEHVASEDGPLPSLADFDAAIVMGSPWSVRSPEVAPWVDDLLGLLRDAVDAEVPVLGVCFGAQAFAEALGGKVFRASGTEVGWRSVESLAPAQVPEGPWFMWHSDTFTLPDGAELLARTRISPQAYRLGPHLLVQFHPEVTPPVVRAWLDHSDDDFRENGLDPEDSFAETVRRAEEARERASELFDRFLADAKL